MESGKYVFFDIDGTIYDYVTGIPDSTRDAVRMLKENGHHPIICTGRTRVMIFDEILELGFDGIVAGCGTYVEWEGKVLYVRELPLEKIIRLVECFRRNGFAAYPEGNEYFYYDPVYIDDPAGSIYKIYQMKIPGHVRPIDYSDMRASKVSAKYTSRSNVQAVIDEVSGDYFWTDHKSLFETVPKDATKGIGVKNLLDHIGADREDTYGFGDSFNDLDMLQLVKHGVVMGNGDEELKKRIPVHTESMLDDGVYKALKRFGLI